MPQPPRDLNLQLDYWDRVAGEKEFTLEPDLTALAALLPPNPRILDYGCGYGRVTAELAAMGHTRVRGVDVSRPMVERGKRLHPGLDLQVLLDPADLAPESLDAVLLIAVLTTLPQDQAQMDLIAGLKKALAPDGVIYIADFLLNHDERNLARYRRFAGQFGVYGAFALDDGGVMRHHSPEWISRLTAGFKTVSLRESVSRTMNGHTSRAFHYLAANRRR